MVQWQNLPKYSFNAKELDEETGMYYYEARYYAPPVFISRDPLMSEKPWLSPYHYCSNNPIGRVDPSGCEDWEPDSDGNLIAEDGDNAQTLATFLGISQTNAQQMINDQNLATEVNNGVINVKAGEKLTIDNVFTRSIKNSTSDYTIDTYFSHTSQTGATPEDYYNCWGSAIAGSQGKEIKKGVGIKYQNIFDNKLISDYFPITEEDAQFGKTVLRFGDKENKTTHGAVFYGKSKDGTIYVYTKNGWFFKPQVMKLSDLQTKIPSYGTVQGINPANSGYYQPK